MAAPDRRLVLRIGGTLAQEGRVPVRLLAEKLNAAQRVLFNIGTALVGGGRRGTWKAEVQRSCSLLFVGTHPGSLEVVAEVPQPAAALFADGDVGPRALRCLSDTLKAIKERDSGTIETLFPDFGRRVRILRSALPLVPEQQDDYEVTLEAAGAAVLLSPDLRQYVARLAREDVAELDQDTIRTVTGKLYLIEVATGQRHLGLMVNNRRIACYYSQEYEDMVRDLIPGSLVEVEGVATLSERGRVEQIEEILDVCPVQLVPLLWRRVVHAERRFRLREAIEIKVDLRDDLWVNEYEPLGILAFGPSRAESLNAFRSDFAACWDCVAQESDENLTADARTLKRKLLDLVEGVEEVS